MTAVYQRALLWRHSLLPEALAHHTHYTHTLLLEPDFPGRPTPASATAAHLRGSASPSVHLLADAAIAHTRITGTQAQRLHHAFIGLFAHLIAVGRPGHGPGLQFHGNLFLILAMR